jgi:quercetin dioxygenase-like cupin family protein
MTSNPFVRGTVFVVFLAGAVWAQTENKPAGHPGHIMTTEAEIVWKDGPPSLPAGAKMAVLEGNPSAPGPFTMRIKVPAGYKIPPHFHPADEHVTVIAGAFSMAVGETFDEKALKDLPSGGFAVMATGTRHFAMSREGGTVQVHGIGPWGITYVNSTDDPRTAARPAAK